MIQKVSQHMNLHFLKEFKNLSFQIHKMQILGFQLIIRVRQHKVQKTKGPINNIRRNIYVYTYQRHTPTENNIYRFTKMLYLLLSLNLLLLTHELECSFVKKKWKRKEKIYIPLQLEEEAFPWRFGDSQSGVIFIPRRRRYITN